MAAGGYRGIEDPARAVCIYCGRNIFYNHLGRAWRHEPANYREWAYQACLPLDRGSKATPPAEDTTPEVTYDAEYIYQKNIAATLRALAEAGVVIDEGSEDYARITATVRALPRLVRSVEVIDYRRRTMWGIPRVPWSLLAALLSVSVGLSIVYGIYQLVLAGH